MLSLMKKYWMLFLVLLLPSFAFAGVSSAWDLYVMGNGDAVRSILEVIKMVTKSSGYTTLLLVLATGGFLMLAVQAGFDPGKHLMRMFMFLVGTYMVITASRNVTTNIIINDPISAMKSDPVVTGVPIIVGLPSAFVSGIGHWMTTTMETAFSVQMPPELALGSGGGFNLFGTMISDAQNFRITNPELKKSLAAYAGDCVIPALARQQLTTKEIKESDNLWDLYKAAASVAVFTRYYNPDAKDAATATKSCGGDNVEFDTGMGGTTTCSVAYACLTDDLKAHAEELLSAKNTQWAATGTQVQWATRMQVALETANGGHNSNAAGMTPGSAILQSAMVNEMSGSFRQAAVSSGTNELLMAAGVASQEAQQKSAWEAGSIIFQNTMGYVYTVLQAFTFALVPMVIIALMIPGMGISVLKNYGQLLVWMALWEPMLAIVNFLILTFSKQTIGDSFGSGLTVQSHYVVSEQAGNLASTARMLGTMVPVMAWGLVKGTLSFSEMISAGMGSSYAAAAGGIAATGNFSQNSLGLNNANNNKYNTASQSQVGNMQTSMFTNSGAGLTTAEHGGGTGSVNGQSLSEVKTNQLSVGRNAATSESAQNNASIGQSADSKISNSTGSRQSSGDSQRLSNAVGSGKSSSETAANAQSDSHGQSHSTDHNKTSAASATQNKGFNASLNGNVGGGYAGNLPGIGGGGGGAPAAAALGAAPGGVPGAAAGVPGGAAGAAALGAAPGAMPGQSGNSGSKPGTKGSTGMGLQGGMSVGSGNSISDVVGASEAARASHDRSNSNSLNRSAGTSLSENKNFSNDVMRGSDHHAGHERSASLSSNASSGAQVSSSISTGTTLQDTVNRTITRADNYDTRDFDSYYSATEINDSAAFNQMIQHQQAIHAKQDAITAEGAGVAGAMASTPTTIGGAPLTAAGAGLGGPDMGLFNSMNGTLSAGGRTMTADSNRLSSGYSATRGAMAGNLTSASNLANPFSMMTNSSAGGIVAGNSTSDKFAMGVATVGGMGVVGGAVADKLKGGGGNQGTRATKILGKGR